MNPELESASNEAWGKLQARMAPGLFDDRPHLEKAFRLAFRAGFVSGARWQLYDLITDEAKTDATDLRGKVDV